MPHNFFDAFISKQSFASYTFDTRQYTEIKPSRLLQQFIHCYWMTPVVPEYSYSGAGAEETVIPDGCMNAGGNMFWGECKIAKCCVDKEHEHCGICQAFPCEELKAFAYDKEHGDPEGTRILNLKKRIEG